MRNATDLTMPIIDGGPASPLIDRTTITSPQIAHSSRRYFFEAPRPRPRPAPSPTAQQQLRDHPRPELCLRMSRERTPAETALRQLVSELPTGGAGRAASRDSCTRLPTGESVPEFVKPWRGLHRQTLAGDFEGPVLAQRRRAIIFCSGDVVRFRVSNSSAASRRPHNSGSGHEILNWDIHLTPSPSCSLTSPSARDSLNSDNSVWDRGRMVFTLSSA
jgi:hypothetical protein